MMFASLSRLAVFLPLSIALVASGCAAETDDGDMGDDEENVGESSEALSASCAISRSQILSSVSGGRRRAIERGFTWWDSQVPYSQSAWYNGYRTDCSGFVSMCWELGTSYTTADFIVGGGDSDRLSSYDELLPGDALVRRANGRGHMFMFLGWNDKAKTSACVIEEAGTALDMEFRSRTTSSLRSSGYRAIRAEKF
jgi:hypothetical protein